MSPRRTYGSPGLWPDCSCCRCPCFLPSAPRGGSEQLITLSGKMAHHLHHHHPGRSQRRCASRSRPYTAREQREGERERETKNQNPSVLSPPHAIYYSPLSPGLPCFALSGFPPNGSRRAGFGENSTLLLQLFTGPWVWRNILTSSFSLTKPFIRRVERAVWGRVTTVLGDGD